MALSALLGALVVAAGVAVVMRAGGVSRNRARQAPGVVTAATAPADPGKAAAPVTRAPSGPSEPSRSTDTAAERQEAATPKSRQPYTLLVGGEFDMESAFEARDRMQALTGFEGWIVPAPDGGGMYCIVLGAYRSHERATGAANMLLKSRTLPDVTVVPLPPQGKRH